MYLILNNLCGDIGDSEFGYRIQGLFAHSLARLGIRILEINPQGHPDIIGEVENRRIKFEVEAVVGKARKRVVEREDLEAIKPSNKNDKGYIAIFDHKLPPEWLLIEYRRLKWRLSESLLMVTLKSLSDKKFSSECTQHFFDLIIANDSRLSKLTFSVLRRKALNKKEL